MIMPAAITQQAKIEAEVRATEAELRPDVAHIRYEVGEDWSGQWAIFFRVVLSDEAAKNRLRAVATDVVWRHALFHLLIADFVANWRVTDQRARLGRMF